MSQQFIVMEIGEIGSQHFQATQGSVLTMAANKRTQLPHIGHL